MHNEGFDLLEDIEYDECVGVPVAAAIREDAVVPHSSCADGRSNFLARNIEMKAYVWTLVFCLAASTAVAQLLQNPDADKPMADKDKPAAGDRPAGPDGPDGPGAFRGPMGPRSNPMFEAIDADGDGVITRTELRKAIVQLRKLDTDKDGNITLAEVSAKGGPGGPMGPGGPGEMFGDPAQMIDRLMQSDKNGDGKLTADELPGQMAQQMIQSGDKDGDNALSKEEITQAMQEMQNRFRGGPGGFQGGLGNFQGGPGAFQGGAGGTGQNQLIGQMMQLDRNGDGKLSSDEVPQQARGMLRGGDQNGDGMIDAMEMRLLIERNGERMRAGLGRGNYGQKEDPRGDKPGTENK